MDRMRFLPAALYAGSATVLMWAIAGDVAASLAGGAAAPATPDVLLSLVGVTVAFGAGAVVAVWERRSSRLLMLGSLAFLLVELTGPLILTPPVDALSSVIGMPVGPWIRLGAVVAATALAWIGLWTYGRRQSWPDGDGPH